VTHRERTHQHRCGPSSEDAGARHIKHLGADALYENAGVRGPQPVRPRAMAKGGRVAACAECVARPWHRCRCQARTRWAVGGDVHKRGKWEERGLPACQHWRDNIPASPGRAKECGVFVARARDKGTFLCQGNNVISNTHIHHCPW
jgi:hypothetical protein